MTKICRDESKRIYIKKDLDNRKKIKKLINEESIHTHISHALLICSGQ